MNKNNINNLKINKGAFNKKNKYRLYVGVLAATLAVGSVFGAGIVGHNIPNNDNSSVEVSVNDEDYFAEVNCNFSNYDDLDDYMLVAFINEDGEIVAAIRINADGSSKNLIANLKPGKYHIISEKGGKDEMIEFEVKDTSEEYTLDINCNDGSMQLHQHNNTDVYKK